MTGGPKLPSMYTRAEALAAGVTDRQLRRWVREGTVVRDRRGHYRRPTNGRTIGDVMAAWQATRAGGAVVSHTSAARYYRLPSPLTAPKDVTLTAASGPTQRRNGVHLRVAPLPASDVRKPGIVVTSPARTVVDCLRTLPEADGLAVADDALRRGLTTAEHLQRQLKGQAGWRGTVKARKVLALADPRRESPLESWSAWGLAQVGVPAPVWQVRLLTVEGVFVARVDAWWLEGVAGEADGRAKYALRAAGEGADPSARRLQKVFDDEKRREARVRDLGADVVTWNTEDVRDPDRLIVLGHRIESRLAAARAHPRFSGRALR